MKHADWKHTWEAYVSIHAFQIWQDAEKRSVILETCQVVLTLTILNNINK